MRKEIYLQATVRIFGEDAPAHDFAASTAQALREIIQAGMAKHPELKVRVMKVAEVEVDDDESGG